ncbi:DUF5358 family protein [Glaesserella parasuis]|uniref:Lipoprotein n=1 Tax=Glaesserella parasuis TaxID=738 RepID=A0A859IJL5_GLAPU|nr:DUF5358 family protein [Glaesserella parasuis]QEM88972.1 hypothetical protein FEF05_11415 [Glaesserella parasuis]QKY73904.1 hypothetical protein FLK62_12370 [Glaesserella parasuis]
MQHSFPKILLASIVLTALTACSSNYNSYIQPKFKISDEQAQQFVRAGNNIEQCIYPKLKGMSFGEEQRKVYSKLSEPEHYVLRKLMQEELRLIIGEQNFITLSNDQVSQAYLSQKHSQFNNQIANVDPQKCNVWKQEFNTELKIAKAEYKKAKQAQLAQQREAERQRKQAEKERKAREAYLKTPAGQAELARQQQLAYQQQMLAQQQAYQQQMLEMQRQAAQQAEFQQFSNQLNSTLQGITRTMQQSTQMYNNATSNMRQSCQNIGQGWGTGAWQNVCY